MSRTKYCEACRIVTTLQHAGHVAYFAGGWVRDHLLGLDSDDIDIATSAPPAIILDLFPETLLVGIQFGIVVVLSDGHPFEVATFRQDIGSIDGRRPERVAFSDAEEDAKRRDFTINGMFFDPLTEEIHDYVGGQQDLMRRRIQTIGNPHERFLEDRLRMLRAFRFSSRFDFTISPETEEAVRENAPLLLPAVAWERIWNEFQKMSKYPRFGEALVAMHRLTLLEVMFPELAHLHLKDLRHRIDEYALFPENTPAIAQVLHLFRNSSCRQKLEIAQRLKCSSRDALWIEQQEKVRRGWENATDLPLWVELLAHPDSVRDHLIFAAGLEPTDRHSFLEHIAHLRQSLEAHIVRKRNRTPLITAQILRSHGILPGIEMGRLLKRGEELAILHNASSAGHVLQLLGIQS